MLLAGSASAGSPRIDFLIHCSGCHLPSGRGQEGSVPDLTAFMGRFAALPAGRAFLVQVPGSSQSPLSNAETAALLNWMLEEFARSDAEPFSEEEVARYRAVKMLDVQERRAELLEAIGESNPGYNR